MHLDLLNRRVRTKKNPLTITNMTKKESQMRMTDAEIAAMIESKSLAIVPNTHGVLAATKDGQIINLKTGRVLK